MFHMFLKVQPDLGPQCSKCAAFVHSCQGRQDSSWKKQKETNNCVGIMIVKLLLYELRSL